MHESDITVRREDSLFTLRAAGVLIESHAVLLQRKRGDSAWALPGGKVRIGESSADAVWREFHEECGLHVAQARVLWVVESLFVHAQQRNHQVCVYHLVESSAGDASVLATSSDDALQLAWVPLAELSRWKVVPRFLVTGLTRLPASTSWLFVDATADPTE